MRQQPYHGPAVEGWPFDAGYKQGVLYILNNFTSAQILQVLQSVRGTTPPRPAGRIPGASVGMHGAPGVGAPPADKWETWIALMKDIGVKWYKQLDDNDLNRRHIFEWCKRLKAAGIEPVVRFYAAQQFPDRLPDSYFQKMRWYADAGIQYAEIGNEPTLMYEWKQHWQARVQNVGHDDPAVIASLAQGWITDAQNTLAAGMRPAYYALGFSANGGHWHAPWSSVFFAQKLAQYLATHFRQETINIFNRGGWIAVHSSPYEQPLDFDPYMNQNGYWDMCMRGYEIVRDSLSQAFGAALNLDAIEILSTESGVFTPNSTSWGHRRPPASPRDDVDHAGRTVEMFRWIEQRSKLKAMMPWCLSVGQLIGGQFDPQFSNDDYVRQINGQLHPRAVIHALRDLRIENEAEAKRMGNPRNRTKPNDDRWLRKLDCWPLLKDIQAEVRKGKRANPYRKNPRRYANGVIGVDVSKWQSEINWSALAQGGANYAFIKCGGADGGGSYIDVWFARNWFRAKQAGLARGAYWFFNPYVNAQDQLDLFWNAFAPGDLGELPLVVDAEYPVNGNGSNGKEELRLLREFLDLVEAKTGVPPMIYTAAWWWNPRIANSDLTDWNRYPLWQAHYTRTQQPVGDPVPCNGWKNWLVWQYSDRGILPGVSGPVDLNVTNCDLVDLMKLSDAKTANIGYTDLSDYTNAEIYQAFLVAFGNSGPALAQVAELGNIVSTAAQRNYKGKRLLALPNLLTNQRQALDAVFKGELSNQHVLNLFWSVFGNADYWSQIEKAQLQHTALPAQRGQPYNGAVFSQLPLPDETKQRLIAGLPQKAAA
ncbi:MAG: glycoside hydrolase family 25 protein [Anaerolineae bacterium]|nr:glycoside hydrolase family 25 protein [Anaerolineae bacterium]